MSEIYVFKIGFYMIKASGAVIGIPRNTHYSLTQLLSDNIVL